MPLVYKIKSVISLPLRASTVDIHTISITANKNCGNEHNLLYIYIQCQSSIHQAVYFRFPTQMKEDFFYRLLNQN